MSCPICCSDRTQKRFEKEGISYYHCFACDFVFSKPSRNSNFTNELDDYEPAYLQYLADFIVSAGRIQIPERLDRFLVTLNLFDIMSVVFQKTPKPTTANTVEETDRPTNRTTGPLHAPPGSLSVWQPDRLGGIE